MASAATARLFDLNIEKILEGWEVSHAIRELIANALDEQALTSTRDVEIFEEVDAWHIRDFGRGLKYEHFTQNENQEKLNNPGKVIGRFGVGLKDALATLSRRGVEVQLRSRYGDVTLQQTAKHGFSDVITLHAAISPAADPSLEGTDALLRRVSSQDIAKAKDFFLRFSGEISLEATQFGEILGRLHSRAARIYVNGIVVAEEENFAFSYNITSLTAAMRRALNRERTNVGRTAYSDRVKAMLLASTSAIVANVLAAELEKIQLGSHSDEVGWMDVAIHACQILNATGKVVFVTAEELILYPEGIDRAENDGFRIITVPQNVRIALKGLKDIAGHDVRDLDVYDSEWQQSFEFKFVSAAELSPSERQIFERWRDITDLVGVLPRSVKEVVISETMRQEVFGGADADGLWEPKTGRIIIKRSVLNCLASFAGTLLHELVHAKWNYGDVSRDFELALTEYLGKVAEKALP